MRPSLRVAAVLSAILCLQSRPAAGQAVTEQVRASVEADVLATNARITLAAQEVDAGRLFAFMLETDRGSVIQNGNLLATREQALEQVKSNFQRIQKIEYRWKRQYVTVLSPDAALLVAEGESSATTGQGDTFTTPFAQTSVFVRRGGEWKILHAHQSSPARR